LVLVIAHTSTRFLGFIHYTTAWGEIILPKTLPKMNGGLILSHDKLCRGETAMKWAMSISIGSSKRDKVVEVELFGEKVRLERKGTDGDMEKAARLYGELDGQADAFGVGGAVLGLMVDDRWYWLPSVKALVKYVKTTPVADGTGLKMTLEKQAAGVVERELGAKIKIKKALLISGVDRYGLTRSFMDAGYESVIGDLMFTLGIPIPIRSDRQLKRVASLLIPIAGRLPFSWVYPTGESQNKHTPKFTEYFKWATVIAGDCHYITKYMPDDMEGKVIVTNTTTPDDRALFKNSGVKYLITTTPVFDGRSFGTNVLESGILAAKGYKSFVDYAHPGNYFHEMEKAVQELQIKPVFQEL
jgi:hypothetical protein